MNSKEIQRKLKTIRVKSLSTLEQESVWEKVRLNIASPSTTKPSKKLNFSTFKKSIAITLIFGMTAGVTFAADGAKPGDTLFVLDRALENILLSISPESKKDELKVKFALERVSEVKNMLKEMSAKPAGTSIKIASPENIVSSQKEESIDTASHQEENTESIQSKNSETEATQTEEVVKNTSAQENDVEKEELTSVDASATPFNTPVAEKTSSTTNDFEQTTLKEDTQEVKEESKTELTSADISEGDKARIELALGTALSFLGDVKGELVTQGNDDAVSYIDLMLEQLNKEIDTLPSNVTFEINLSAKKELVKFEITSDENKPKVQIEIEETSPSEDSATSKEGIEKTDEETSKTKTLEIKDGNLSITETKDDSEQATDTEETKEDTQTSTTTTASTTNETNNEENANESSNTQDSGTTTSATSSNDTSSEATTTPDKKEDGGTTTVKVIIKKLENDFELSVTDKSTEIHDIIEDLIEKNKEV